MAQFQAGEVKIHYEVHGSGEPLLMIMGLGLEFGHVESGAGQ